MSVFRFLPLHNKVVNITSRSYLSRILDFAQRTLSVVGKFLFFSSPKLSPLTNFDFLSCPESRIVQPQIPNLSKEKQKQRKKKNREEKQSKYHPRMSIGCIYILLFFAGKPFSTESIVIIVK